MMQAALRGGCVYHTFSPTAQGFSAASTGVERELPTHLEGAIAAPCLAGRTGSRGGNPCPQESLSPALAPGSTYISRLGVEPVGDVCPRRLQDGPQQHVTWGWGNRGELVGGRGAESFAPQDPP